MDPADDEPTYFQLHQLCEDFIEVTFAAGIEDMELQSESAGGRQNLLDGGFGK